VTNASKVPTVAKHIESALLSQGMSLWQEIRRYPFSWIDFGRRISSKPIFGEALIQLVGEGRHRNEPFDLREDLTFGNFQLNLLGPKTKRLVLHKSNALLAKCRDVDNQLMAMYLPEMERDVNDLEARIDRHSYGLEVYEWLAVSLFRQWFGQLLADVSDNDGPH